MGTHHFSVIGLVFTLSVCSPSEDTARREAEAESKCTAMYASLRRASDTTLSVSADARPSVSGSKRKHEREMIVRRMEDLYERAKELDALRLYNIEPDVTRFSKSQKLVCAHTADNNLDINLPRAVACREIVRKTQPEIIDLYLRSDALEPKDHELDAAIMALARCYACREEAKLQCEAAYLFLCL